MKNNLRIILATQKKSLQDVHNGTGLSMTTLSGVYGERATNPQAKTLIKIAKYLDVTMDELLGIEKITK